MGELTFTGSPYMFVNTKNGSSMSYAVMDVSTNPPTNLRTVTQTSSQYVRVISGRTYKMSSDSTGTFTITGVTCTTIPKDIGNINFTMTFKLMGDSSNVKIDQSTVTVKFDSFIIHYSDSNLAYYYDTNTITSYQLSFPYVITIGGTQIYSTGTAVNNVGMK